MYFEFVGRGNRLRDSLRGKPREKSSEQRDTHPADWRDLTLAQALLRRPKRDLAEVQLLCSFSCSQTLMSDW